MIIYRKTHENITLFYYSGCYHILFETHGYFLCLKPMVNIIFKKYWRSLFKSPKENIIYEIIHSKIMRTYTSYYLKPMEINTWNLS